MRKHFPERRVNEKMQNFLKQNYRLILSTFLGVLLGCVLGLVMYPNLIESEDGDTTTVDHIGRVNILPDTIIQCVYRFSGCEHTIERQIDPLTYVGQTQDEFLNEYRDHEIESFSSELVQLRCLRLGPCPQHIMLRADEMGQLIVYQTSEQALEVKEIQLLPIYAASFPSEIAEELYEGIVFSSIDEINEYLENAES